MAEEKMLYLTDILKQFPVGNIHSTITNNLYGINFTQTGNPLPRPKDHYGFTFFTRPQLNLTLANVSNYRGFYSLLTENRLSYQRYVRCMLDPRLARGWGKNLNTGVTSPLVDENMCFIPILTNSIKSLSGWPDIVVPTYTSEPGNLNQEFSFVDGGTNEYEAYDIDVTFKNFKGNPLIYLFYIWIKYESLVYEGILSPYLDMVTENEIDYNTRIYRIVLDDTKRYVRYIACTGASFPVNVPIGSLFDFNSDTPYNSSLTDISIRFRSMGFIAFEDMVKYWFNKIVATFNADMRAVFENDLDASGTSETNTRDDPTKVYKMGNYAKIPHFLVSQLSTSYSYFAANFRVYPYINLFTNELEWWTEELDLSRDIDSLFKNSIEENGLGTETENQEVES